MRERLGDEVGETYATDGEVAIRVAGEFKLTRGSGEEDEAMLWDGELTGDKADVLTTLAYDNTLPKGPVERIARFGEEGGKT